MIIIFVLIPVSIVAATIFLTAFIWAVRSGQYDDTCTPAMRLLGEDATPAVPEKSKDILNPVEPETSFRPEAKLAKAMPKTE